MPAAKLAAKASRRLTADERREAIIRAAVKVFSEHGFHGTTTRALAREAGVSEALIFRHFPSKDELYQAMQAACCAAKNPALAEGVLELEPSTSTLVLIIHFFMAKMLRPPQKRVQEENSLYRLLMHSYMGDGEFARGFLKQGAADVISKLEACIVAATKAGDMESAKGLPAHRAWLAQHLAAMLMLNELPGRPVVELSCPLAQQVEEATWFALRGIGLKDAVIQRHYNPKAFALLMS